MQNNDKICSLLHCYNRIFLMNIAITVENLYKPYHITVKGEDRFNISLYYDVLLYYIEKEEKIPHYIVSEFLLLLNDSENLKHKEFRATAIPLSQIAAERILREGEYDIQWKTIVNHEQSDIEVKVNIEDITMELITAFLHYQSDKPACQKEEAIRFFHDLLADEYKPRLSKSNKKNLTTYKMGVIAGILTTTIGFKLTISKDPKNRQIFDAVRNALNKRKR